LILFKSETLVGEVTKAYDKFNFCDAYRQIYNFCNIELSSFYLDVIKGRLYTYASNSLERRAAQTVIYEVLNTLIRLMAPVLIFTTEEIWQNLPKIKADKLIPSIHLLEWPQRGMVSVSEEVTRLDSLIFSLKPDIDKLLEARRGQGEIGSSFDAKINLLTNNQDRYTVLTGLEDELGESFKVSRAKITKVDIFDKDLFISSVLPDIAIKIFKADGAKCQRCWNYSQSVGTDKTHPLICNRCLDAIRMQIK
jgi:isoleucyl-tRNA synthetase